MNNLKIFVKNYGAQAIIILFILIVHFIYLYNINLYSFSFNDNNDQALFQRIAYNIAYFNKFSGSLTNDKYFCVTRSPLYPYILSCSYLFKIKSHLFIISFQFVLTIAIIILLFYISSEVFQSRQAKFFVVILACIDPHLIATTHLILSENISLFLLLLFIFSMQKRYIILTGIASGLLILNRPVFMPYLLIFLSFLFFMNKINLKKILYINIIVLILILPWSYLNKIEINQYVLTRAAGSGFNLFQNIIYILNEKNKISLSSIVSLLNKEVTINTHRSFHQKCDSLICNDSIIATKIYLRSWSINPYPPSLVIEADQYLKKISLNYILHHKMILFDMFINSFKVFLFNKYNFLIYSPIPYIYFLYGYIFKSILLVCSIFTSIMWLKESDKKNSLIFSAMVILIFNLILIHSIFHSEPRYYIYVYPFMYICCIYFLQKTISFLRNLVRCNEQKS